MMIGLFSITTNKLYDTLLVKCSKNSDSYTKNIQKNSLKVQMFPSKIDFSNIFIQLMSQQQEQQNSTLFMPDRNLYQLSTSTVKQSDKITFCIFN